MGREKCFKKGSKKPTLSAKEERIAKRPEGRISCKSSLTMWVLEIGECDVGNSFDTV